MFVLLLADNLNPWHSVWMRVGQYLSHLPVQWLAQTECAVARDAAGLCFELDRQPNCIVLYRYAPASTLFLDTLRAAKSRGCRIIADLDDDLWSQEFTQTVGKQGWDRLRLAWLNRGLRLADVITTSTPELQLLAAAMFPQQAVALLPNSAPLNPSSVPLWGENAGPLRLGWTGAPWTRAHDLQPLRELAQWVQQQCDVRFVHMGHNGDKISFAEVLGIPANFVDTVPFLPHADYLRQLHFDIGLAPLAPTLFNAYKSDLKLLEYSSMGIPWLASNAMPYRELATTWGMTELLCPTPEDFISGVQRLRRKDCLSATRQRLLALSQGRSFASTLAGWAELLDPSHAIAGVHAL